MTVSCEMITGSCWMGIERAKWGGWTPMSEVDEWPALMQLLVDYCGTFEIDGFGGFERYNNRLLITKESYLK